MIASLTEIKALLQITTSDNDSLINSLIPLVESDLIRVLNNRFKNKDIYILSSNLTFNSSDNSIVSSDINFEDENFINNQSFFIENSLYNDGFYTINSVSGQTIIINELYRLVANENSSQSILIQAQNFPRDLKLIVSNMVRYRLTKFDVSLKSEKIDDYSYTLNTDNLIGGYPAMIFGNAFNCYRKVYYD